jgi:hypothetical protein
MTTPHVRALCTAVAALSLLVTGCSSSSGGEGPRPPSAPTGLTAIAGDGQVTLSWTPVSGASSYAAYYGTAAGVTKANGTRIGGITAPPRVVSGLANGTTYHFVVTAICACGESAESGEASATPTGPTFTQADLTGDWDVLQFSTNSSPGWAHLHVRLDASGQVEVLEFLDDTGATDLPPPGFDLRATVAPDGTVRFGGADGSPAFHGTMTRTKTLVLGTDEEGEPVSRRNLHAWRKRVTGVTYSSADIAGFAFAVHGVYAGPGNSWMHGSGTTDAAGILSLAEVHDSSGGSGSPGQVGTLAIDATGLVQNVGGVLRGVMTADKNAIFFVDSTGDAPTNPGLLVVLRTGRTFALADLAGDRARHAVTSGAAIDSSLWLHGETTIDATGSLAFTSAEDSAGSTVLPPERQLALSPAGVLTITADPTFHGQLSWDGDFYVDTSGGLLAPGLGASAR